MEDVRVAICIPSSEEVNAQFMISLIGMLVKNQIPIATVANCMSSRIAFNRNFLVEQARYAKATHLLYIDSDMIFPEDSLKRLLSHDVEIVGATASRRSENDDAIGVTLDGERLQVSSDLVKMKLLGPPLMLIKMSVFNKLRAPWFAEPPRYMVENDISDTSLMAEDEYFCHTAIAAGLNIWCDVGLSMEIGHRGAKTYYIMKPQMI